MYIASKMEEIIAPKMKDFAKSTNDGYSKKQIAKMEEKICIAL